MWLRLRRQCGSGSMSSACPVLLHGDTALCSIWMPLDTVQGTMSTSSCGCPTLDDVAGRSRSPPVATLDHLRTREAGPAFAGVVLATGRAQALRGTEAPRRGRPRHRDTGDDRSAAADRVRDHAQGTRRAEAMARRAAGAPHVRVRRNGEGVLRRRRDARAVASLTPDDRGDG